MISLSFLLSLVIFNSPSRAIRETIKSFDSNVNGENSGKDESPGNKFTRKTFEIWAFLIEL